MEASNFEAVKVALKQDKTGFILTLSIHPDDLPAEVLRDFVGARYQVAMVRINGDEQPMDRSTELSVNPVQMAGILCKDEKFIKFLIDHDQIHEPSENLAVEWLRKQLGVSSRSELKGNQLATKKLVTINKEFNAWKRS